MSMMPNTSVNPAASRNSIRPNWMPLSPCSRKSVAVIEEFVDGARTTLLHAAFAQPVVLVRRKDGGDLAVDDAALAVLHQRTHVVVLDRRAVCGFLPLPARRLRPLRRLHQGGAECLGVLDLAFRILDRLVDDQRGSVALLRVEGRDALVLLLELRDEFAVRVVVEVVGPLRRVEEAKHRLPPPPHHVPVRGETRAEERA